MISALGIAEPGQDPARPAPPRSRQPRADGQDPPRSGAHRHPLFVVAEAVAPSRPAMPVAEARRLLGVSEDANLEDIRSAHRRLIAKVHPDRADRPSSPSASMPRAMR
jgi:hypothetical protein